MEVLKIRLECCEVTNGSYQSIAVSDREIIASVFEDDPNAFLLIIYSMLNELKSQEAIKKGDVESPD